MMTIFLGVGEAGCFFFFLGGGRSIPLNAALVSITIIFMYEQRVFGGKLIL